MLKSLPKILLAFDFGMRNIGVAVGQTITHSATPLTILKAQDGIPDWNQIADLITTWHANGLVVGIPYNLDGSEQPVSLAARKFARRLESRFKLPVFLVDERFTTKVAKIEMQDKAQLVDSYAAKLILESWLMQQAKE